MPHVSIEYVSGSLEVAAACVRRLEALGSYEFNAVPGEQRQFVFDDWLRCGRMLEWLAGGADGADGVSSGDVYARLRARSLRLIPPSSGLTD